MIYRLFFFLTFIFISSFFVTKVASAATVDGWAIDMNFSNPSCSGSGLDVINVGGNQYAMRFSPKSTTLGYCEVKAWGKGDVGSCGSSTDTGGTVSGGTTATYYFNICDNGGSQTSWGVTGRYDVVAGCTPQGTQTQTISCPSGYSGSITQTRTSTCPGPTWSSWTTTSNTCTPNPSATISASPPSSYSPGNITINWSTANIPGGTTCTNSWNAFLPITPNTSGSDVRVLGAGTYTFTISCGSTTASTSITVSNLPPPALALNTPPSCVNSSPYLQFRLTAPSSVSGQVLVNLYMTNTSQLVFQRLANPGEVNLPSNLDFNPGYQQLTPNTNYTFYATTSLPGKNPSTAAVLSVTTADCPYPPTLAVTKNSCNGNEPDVELTMTSPSNAGISLNHWLDLVSTNGTSTPANLAVRNLTPGSSAVIPNTAFNAPYTTLQNKTSYIFKAYNWNNNFSSSVQASLTTIECNGPKPFSLTLDTLPVCPADGNPKLNIKITKSINSEYYDIRTFTKDSSGNYTVPVATATETAIPASVLFPGTTTTVSKSYTVLPNQDYGVYAVAYKGSGASLSYIYSNTPTMNTVPSQSTWITTHLGWCDTQPPQITLMNLIRDCYQPDTWLEAQPIQVIAGDGTTPGASGLRDVSFSLEEASVAENYKFPATLQESLGNGNYSYIRNFTNSDLSAGLNKNYLLGAKACDFNNQCSMINKKPFYYTNICIGWIQTRGGNVHSEQSIITPGGP